MECTKRNLITRVSTFYPAWSDHAYFDHLSNKTYAKHSFGAKRLDLRSLSRRLPNIWLLPVVFLNRCELLLQNCDADEFTKLSMYFHVSFIQTSSIPWTATAIWLPTPAVRIRSVWRAWSSAFDGEWVQSRQADRWRGVWYGWVWYASGAPATRAYYTYGIVLRASGRPHGTACGGKNPAATAVTDW